MTHARKARRMAVTIALIIPLSSGGAKAGAPSHDDEITTYATALAIAQVASQRCAHVLAYADGLTALRDYLHLEAADDMALQVETRGMIRPFEDLAAPATSVEAWCEGAYKAFGLEVTAMRGLLAKWWRTLPTGQAGRVVDESCAVNEMGTLREGA